MARPSARVTRHSLRPGAGGLTPATTLTEAPSSPGLDPVVMRSNEEPRRPGSTEGVAPEDDLRLSQDSGSLTIPSNDETKVPPSEGHAIALGAGVTEALTVVAKLQTLGLDQYEIPLPKCVVLGDQSTGKSSVIEAISGIKTPRATDTCTRCPLFIKIEPAKDPGARWEACVFLRLRYVHEPQRRGGNEQRFQGWIQLPGESEEVKFAKTDSPDELENLIARAQLAILSGGIEHQLFLHGPLEELEKHYRRADFSPNCVCIYISHPGLASLSFYDLPGIIGQSEDDKTHFLVKFVKDLVTEYVQDKESLILVACSLENDIHNSTAAGIARELNATDRCVGVLTKPDRLPAGSRVDKIRAILEGRSFKLGHDYFVVKNLGQQEINAGFTNRDARAEEEKFFSTVEPWATELQSHKDRFGTAALQAYLSDKLAAQMLRALPTIRHGINERLSAVSAELELIPKPPTHNAMLKVTEILRDFTQNIQKDIEIDGSHDETSWRNQWEGIKDSFNNGLAAMKPALKPWGTRDLNLIQSSSKGNSPSDCIVIDSDDDGDESGNVQGPSTDTPSKKRKLGASDGNNTPKKQPVRGNVKVEAKPMWKPGNDELVRYKTRLDLDDIGRRIKATSKSRIPGELQPKVLDRMMINTLEQWHRPLDRFFNELEEKLRAYLESVFDEHFRAWRDAELYRAAWKVVEKLLQDHIDEQRHTMAPETLKDELEGPYIYYKEVWHDERCKVDELYKSHRIRARTKNYFDEWDSIYGKTTTPNEREKLSQKAEHRDIIVQEPYELELGVASKIISYYNIASRRFHDSICMRVESKLFKALRTTLFGELVEALTAGPQGHENCIRLLADDPDRELRRRELIRIKDSLLRGLQELDKLQGKYNDPSMVKAEQQGFNLPLRAPTVEQGDLMIVDSN
ncbi:P-loop containing nucleoside triphosphate hydrolase protein [Westerdykella ornata]|uniref:P-loop containing nucleoside triphosphate hydrolase protein n=1 Tax=Westerdykella ornata TaxID=318751 RepID=A0A6A6JIC8_WESOR|nr:P-loop containing nucleoside triphosphate hydrolase protein [Westerdykella ornata]KAF2275396.1 P-loop containing nucleoside triphosphate hydrolase protein [Westerdykella ornata]